MVKINNYEYLLKDLTELKGIGVKTSNILRKKKFLIFSIYCGDCHNPI